MSLDVYLISPKETDVTCTMCSHVSKEKEDLYWANITHNLGKMAQEACIYMWLWRPDELGVTTASELIDPLTNGLSLLKSKPEHFKQFNSPNGWGMYEHFVPFVEQYLEACINYPYAEVRASR